MKTLLSIILILVGLLIAIMGTVGNALLFLYLQNHFTFTHCACIGFFTASVLSIAVGAVLFITGVDHLDRQLR